MDTYKTTALVCIEEVRAVLDQVKEQELSAFAEALTKAKRIFISGDGRSGLMGKAIAMRLMHADYNVFVTGETITPSIKDGDLLVLISGSATGNTATDLVQKAIKAGAETALVTANPDNEVGRLCKSTLFIPAATKQRKQHEPATVQPLGNQFDQSVHLLLDSIIVKLTAKQQEAMRARHANLE
ncbi:6-phospho-3-hexuloisomerase [Bacillus sp. JCM 19041]|uniref:6-phospho-3-hexuloisomerase n=1 Tax=Bacillus sp. JCM 19041 TaxID=1460637 RepID=UPI0006D112B2